MYFSWRLDKERRNIRKHGLNFWFAAASATQRDWC